MFGGVVPDLRLPVGANGSSLVKGVTVAAYLSIGWLLVSWWRHDSLHIANGLNLNGLIAIEYEIHVTLMVSGVILACFFYALEHQQLVRSQ